MIASMAVALATFLVYLIACTAAFRLFHNPRPLLTMSAALIACLPVAWAIEPHVESLPLIGSLAAAVPEPVLASILSVGIFGFLYFGYFHVYGLIELSISPRMMVHILRHEGESMTLKELEAVYSFDDLFRRKIDEAVQYGLMTETSVSGERAFENSGKGNLMGLFFLKVKEFTRWGLGG